MTLRECLARIEIANELPLDERHQHYLSIARAIMREVVWGNVEGKAMMREFLQRTSEV